MQNELFYQQNSLSTNIGDYIRGSTETRRTVRLHYSGSYFKCFRYTTQQKYTLKMQWVENKVYGYWYLLKTKDAG